MKPQWLKNKIEDVAQGVNQRGEAEEKVISSSGLGVAGSLLKGRDHL